MRQRIPVLLEEFRSIARTRNLPEPNSECKAGWCLQCQCPSMLIQEMFGDVEYIIEPQIPPISGSILPCISRRLVMTFDLKEMFSLAMDRDDVKTCRAHRKEPVFARSFNPHEFGQVHTAKTISGVVVKSTFIKASDVLVKQKLEFAKGVAESVVSIDSFVARYSVAPGVEFGTFYDEVGLSAVELSSAFIRDLAPEDGALYVRHNREVITVVPGDLVTSAGALVKRELLGREFSLVYSNREIIKEEIVQELKW